MFHLPSRKSKSVGVEVPMLSCLKLAPSVSGVGTSRTWAESGAAKPTAAVKTQRRRMSVHGERSWMLATPLERAQAGFSRRHVRLGEGRYRAANGVRLGQEG